MYGKIFASLFTGSMRGKGDLQLVFTYMISNANKDGICDFMPVVIADATGKPLELVEECLRVLESPDPLSRSRNDDGRRIKLLDPDRPWGWQIVNYKSYREIATQDALREAERLRKREQRATKGSDTQVVGNQGGAKCPGHVRTKVGHSPSPSSSSSEEEESVREEGTDEYRKQVSLLKGDTPVGYPAWLTAYHNLGLDPLKVHQQVVNILTHEPAYRFERYGNWKVLCWALDSINKAMAPRGPGGRPEDPPLKSRLT